VRVRGIEFGLLRVQKRRLQFGFPDFRRGDHRAQLFNVRLRVATVGRVEIRRLTEDVIRAHQDLSRLIDSPATIITEPIIPVTPVKSRPSRARLARLSRLRRVALASRPLDLDRTSIASIVDRRRDD
jgi:hypothetical protein